MNLGTAPGDVPQSAPAQASTQMKAARIAGAAYFLIIASSILSLIVGPSRLVVEGQVAQTYRNIAANELLFRGGVLYDLAMYASVVVLAVALYVVLKPVNENLALVALLWRLGEAILGCLSVLVNLVVLLVVGEEDFLSAFAPEQLQAAVGLLLDVNSAVTMVVFVFLSLGSIIFCYLFYESRYIPRWLSGFGVAAFALTLAGACAGILYANDAVLMFGVPAILFEITVGLWLWIKGIKIRQEVAD